MKNRILFLAPGPLHNASSAWGRRLKMLSPNFYGTLLTTGHKPEVTQLGEFEAILLGSTYGRGILMLFRLTIKLILVCLKAKQEHKPYDLIVTYDPLRSGLLGILAAKLSGAKLLIELNGVFSSPHIYADMPPAKQKFRAWITPKVVRFVLSQADAIKLQFPSQLEPFNLDLSKKTVRAYANFTDVLRFENQGEQPEVLFVGFPLRLKGVDILIEAFKRVAPEFPEWKLKILGWYPDTTTLYSLIANHPQIYHHPPVDHADMPKHIGQCAIFVLPSRTEALGRVLIESMAAGKPRIGSRVDGTPSLIDDGVDGLLFETENAADLADKLRTLMSNSTLRESMGKAGAIRARTQFTAETYLTNTVNFYLKVIETKH